MWFIYKISWIYETPKKIMKKKAFKDKFGILFEELIVSKYSLINEYMLYFLIRRFIYALFVVFLYDYPNIQLLMINLFISIPVTYTIIVDDFTFMYIETLR